MEQKKYCGICQTIKSVSEFYRCSCRKDGLQTKCKACSNMQSHTHYLNHTQEYIDRTTAYSRSHPEIRRKVHQKRQHREDVRAYHREWIYLFRQRNPEYYRELDRKRSGTPARLNGWRTKEYRRRAVTQLQPLSETAFANRVAFYGSQCAYCHVALQPDEITRDHRIPLARGGTNLPANLVPACRHCNSSKGGKTAREFLAWRQTHL